MKKTSIICFLFFLLTSNSFSKEVNLSCNLSHFFKKENVLDDLQQIPLSKVGSSYLQKVTLSFNVENKKFLNSNLIYPDEYKSVIFSDDEIFFVTKGFQNNKDPFYYDTRLNRLSGELTRIIKVTESRIQALLKTPNAHIGFEQKEIYQCKVVNKLF